MKQKSVLITGCSSGFGLESAIALAKQGFLVYATMRDLSKKQDLELACKASNVSVEILQLDVTSDASIEKVVEHIEKSTASLDVLINNAGYVQIGFFEELTEEEIQKQLETNFFGVQKVTRKCLNLLKEAPQGRIINISSNAGLNAYPGLGAYNASKWALEAFSESLRFELKACSNVGVFLVEPGAFPTKCLDENKQLAKNTNTINAYQNMNKAVKGVLDNLVKRSGNSLEDVIQIICYIATAKRSSFRNLVGKGVAFRFFLRRILPWSIYEKLALRKMGMVNQAVPES